MKISPDHYSSKHSKRLSAFFGDLDRNIHRATSSHEDDLAGFFAGLGPIVGIAQQVQHEYDRRTAPRFILFDFFDMQEKNLSRILVSLLDPLGAHGQSDTFLKLFLNEVRKVLNKNVRDDFPGKNLRDVKVFPENSTANGRLIDIVLKLPGNAWIGIENKPWADEQLNQVSDYLEDLESRGDAWLVYLSGDGKSPMTLPCDPKKKMRCPTFPYRSNQHGSPSLETWIGKCRIACEAERVKWFLTDLLAYIRNQFGTVGTDPGGTGDRS